MVTYYIAFVFFLLLLSINVNGAFDEVSVPPPPSSEVYALQQFCLRLGGCEAIMNDWNLHSHATDTATVIPDPCKQGWEGVKCLYDPQKQLTHIHYISLVDKAFHGPIGPALAILQALPFLEHLAFYNNQLTGHVPELLLPRLKLLRLDQNDLSGPILLNSLIRASTDLRYLDLSKNKKLRGPIPDMSSLVKMERLLLYDMQLTGEVPLTLGMLPLLKELRLDSNELVGQIPSFAKDGKELLRTAAAAVSGGGAETDEFADAASSLQNMRSIEVLDLHNNTLTGPLPHSLSTLNTLKELHLYMNLLTGSIPRRYGDLVELKAMRLDLNHLTGQIPHELSQLTNLEFLGMGGEFNRLHGKVPEYAKYRRNLTIEGRVCDPALMGNSTLQKYDVKPERGASSLTNEDIDSEEMLQAIKLAAFVFVNKTTSKH